MTNKPNELKHPSDSWWFIFATGPSFKRDDALQLKGHGITIAVNNAVFYAPWADYLYAGDEKWWQYHEESISWFKGQRVTHQAFSDNHVFKGCEQFKRFGGNSGHQAIQFAASIGARRIALLGFDQQFTNGQKHCHGDHPDELGNATTIENYPRFMEQTARDLEALDIEVINLTRETALTCFERVSVEDFVCGL